MTKQVLTEEEYYAKKATLDKVKEAKKYEFRSLAGDPQLSLLPIEDYPSLPHKQGTNALTPEESRLQFQKNLEVMGGHIAASIQANGFTTAPWTFIAQGTKYDEAKPRMDLLDAEFLEGVAQVLTFGANKYSANNWRGGINYSRLIAACYRHLGAISRGEDLDAESGLPHVHHLGCTVQFLSWMQKHKPELDDRYKAK